MSDRLLPISEVATILDLSVSTVRRLIGEKKLDHCRPSPRRIKVPSEALKAYIRCNTSSSNLSAGGDRQDIGISTGQKVTARNVARLDARREKMQNDSSLSMSRSEADLLSDFT